MLFVIIVVLKLLMIQNSFECVIQWLSCLLCLGFQEPLFQEAKNELIQYFQSIKKLISLTADGWSVRKLNHYFSKIIFTLGFTVHYLSNNNNTNNTLQSLIPSVKQDGEVLGQDVV